MQMGEHVFEVVRFAAQKGRHVLQNRLFAQIEANHLGDIGVDRFVVRNAGADRVADRHVAGAIRVHQTGAAQRRGGAEHLGVEEVIVDAAVDHIHALQATRRAHVDEVVLDLQVLPFDQFHAHLLREKRVLEVGAVVHAGREHHHGRVGAVGRCAGAQGVEQHVRVMHDRRDLVLREQIGKQPHHHLAVFQHV